jgi:two-component system nitrogen regulation response regulator GlnG
VKVDVRVIAATHQDLETLVKEGRFREDLYHRLNVIRIRIPSLSERSEDIPLLMRHFLVAAAKELQAETKRVQPDVMERLQRFDWPGNVRQLENVCRWLTVMAPGQDVHLNDLPPELREAGGAPPAAVKAPSPPMVEAPVAAIETGALAEASNPIVESPAPIAVALPRRDTWFETLRAWADGEFAAGRSGLLEEAMPLFERTLILSALNATRGQRQEAARRLGWGRNTLTRKIQELGMDP